MPILRIVRREADEAQYDAVNAKMQIERKHPLGLIMHGTTTVNGKIEVAQVWDSEKYAERFDEELKPALEAAGVSLDADVTVYQLEHLVTP
jgi:hypothetical protein